MRRTLLVLLVVLATLVSAPSASAIKYGTADTGNQYPWVGLVVFYDANGNPLWRCSGSLLSSDLFLTAGHCTEDPAATAAIWFDVGPIQTDPQYIANLNSGATDLCAGVTGYPCGGYDAIGTPESHPNWNGSLTIPQTSDVGVVYDLTWVGDMPTRFGTIAEPGTLDNLTYTNGKGNVEFTVVGYGLQGVKPVELSAKTRMIATVSLVNLQSVLSGGWNLQYSNNPGLGHGGSGGTCFGDSGGPVLYNGEIVAVNSFVLNNNCAGAGFGYRVDTTYAQSFIFGRHPAT
ncbi:MAG TPA: trypsin-like serine protease [Gaiellaceae bacterium]|jgi:hypothetical protein|nr:trypsin-like serine protease [Gaiellaceae bacterium]